MNLKDINVVVFDIGNVLLSFGPLEYLRSKYDNEGLVNILNEEVFKSEEWLLLDRGTITEQEAVDIISKRIPEQRRYVKDIIENFHEKMLLPIDSSVELVSNLKDKGFKLYLLSNFHKSAFQAVYERYEFLKLFNGGIISSNYKLLKPEKKIYYTLIDKYELTSRKALFIDDTKENTDMAETIGFRTLWTKGEALSSQIDKGIMQNKPEV